MANLRSKLLTSSLLSSVGLAILGGLLIFKSEFAILSISYTIGAILIAIGILAILDFIKNMKQSNKNELNIVYGIVTVVMGIIVISNPEAVASIIPFVVGFVIMVSSALKLQYSFELKKKNNELWTPTMIISAIMLLCGILLVFNPFKGAEIFTKFIGIVMLIYAVLDIISTIKIKNTIKTVYTEIEEHVVEAEVIKEESNDSKKDDSKEEIKSETPNLKKNSKKKKKRNPKKESEES